MRDFEVKSNVHNYDVKFIDDSASMLKIEIKHGDVLIMDKKIKNLHPK